MDKKKLIKMELFGATFVFLFGLLVKYAYILSGGDVWSYFISSINNSAWEQMKPFTFPFFIWTVIEMAILRPSVAGFATSKIVAFYIYWAFGLFYMVMYNSFFEGVWRALLFGGLFIIILFGHFVSYELFTKAKAIENFFVPALAAIVIFIAMFILFTPYTPHGALFFDAASGTYGLAAIHS